MNSAEDGVEEEVGFKPTIIMSMAIKVGSVEEVQMEDAISVVVALGKGFNFAYNFLFDQNDKYERNR